MKNTRGISQFFHLLKVHQAPLGSIMLCTFFFAPASHAHPSSVPVVLIHFVLPLSYAVRWRAIVPWQSAGTFFVRTPITHHIIKIHPTHAIPFPTHYIHMCAHGHFHALWSKQEPNPITTPLFRTPLLVFWDQC